MNDLKRRLAKGDETAFAELFDMVGDRLWRWLVMRLNSREDAEDALQETFVRLAKSRKQFAKVENLEAYCFQVARNEANRIAASRGRRKRLVERSRKCERETAAPGAEIEAEESAREALARLTADEREVIELKIFGELKFREIAETLGLPQGTVATRYRTALERLRVELKKELA